MADQLGNISALDYMARGAGKVFLSSDGSNFTYVGETHDLTVSTEVETEKIADTESCAGGTLLESVLGRSVSLSFSTRSQTPENIARFFAGGVGAGDTAVSDELVIVENVKKGEYFNIGHSNITSITVEDSTDTTTYIKDTDYIVTDGGLVGVIKSGAISDGDTLHVTVSTSDTVSTVEFLSGEVKNVHFRFEACDSNGKKRLVELYSVNLLGSGDAPLKGEETTAISFEGEALPDLSKGDGTTTSQYGFWKFL